MILGRPLDGLPCPVEGVQRIRDASMICRTASVPHYDFSKPPLGPPMLCRSGAKTHKPFHDFWQGPWRRPMAFRGGAKNYRFLYDFCEQ